MISSVVEAPKVKKKDSKCPFQQCVVEEKGVIIILIWTFALFCVYHYVFKIYNLGFVRRHHVIQSMFFLTPLTTGLVPIAGFMADIYIGRYKVVQYSMRVTWLGVLVYTLIDTVFADSISAVSDAGRMITIFIMIVGMCGFQANVVQFSMDQLLNASSQRIKCFIYMYYWTFAASGLFVEFAQICTPFKYEGLILPLLLSLALCSEFLLNHWLIKEPVSHNPLKLIVQVLKYAWKNKYPRQRSAFTYWDDKPFSRIDLGKAKYGGPFTLEQVEDVKTFFRIVVVMGVASLCAGILTHGDNLILRRANPFKNRTATEELVCFKKLLYFNFGEILVTLLIPFSLAVRIHKCLPGLSILKKCGLGIAVILACLYAVLFLQLKQDLGDAHINNATEVLQCVGIDSDITKNWWITGPSLLAGIGEFLLFASCLEFICAQSPYSMKGLLLGFLYTGFGISLFIIFSVDLLFNKMSHYFAHSDMSCRFWYFLHCSVGITIDLVVFVMVSIWYKKRQREDNLPSQHYFAEEYYGNLVQEEYERAGE